MTDNAGTQSQLVQLSLLSPRAEEPILLISTSFTGYSTSASREKGDGFEIR
jgi:hypothetical protein